MFQKGLRELIQWIIRHQTILTVSVGSGIVAIWTVLRHITNGINFDVVGQVGVAAQWAHGLHGGAVFGATNYLLKMPLYALINATPGIPPVVRLLILALICSVGAYLLIYCVARKVARLYGVKNLVLLNLGVLWLAIIAGRVFWVDYANSRNLEVAGGLAVLYLVLRTWEKGADWRRALAIIGLAALVFFADPLQLYIIGGGLGMAAAALVLKSKGEQRRRGLIGGGVLVASAILSRIFAWVSTVVLPVSYLDPPRSVPALGVDSLTTLAQNTVASTLRIFDVNVFSKAFGVNSLRQLGGMLLLGLTIYILIRYRKAAAKRPLRVLCWLVMWSYLVYFASGNALTAMTERYLIMVPVLVVVLLGLYGDLLRPVQYRRLVPLWLITVAASGVLLAGATILQWPSRYHLDKPMFATADFVSAHRYDFVVTSRGLAIPGNYYAGYEKTVVPTMCVDNTHIVATNLFYDQAGYSGRLGRTNGTVAVVLPGEGVISDPFSCSTAAILDQLGSPQRVFDLPNVGTVYEYDGSTDSLRGL